MSQDELEYLIEHPRNTEALDKAKKHQEYLKYHVEGEKKYAYLMKSMMADILVKDKLKMFNALLYPSSKFLYHNIKRDLYALHTADGRVVDVNIEDEAQRGKLFESVSTLSMKCSTTCI